MESFTCKKIATLKSDFTSKFGVPRQSGLVPELLSRVVFEPEFRSPEALRGIEGFSHLWLIWEFSKVADKGWSPTVRPPRLGGNKRLGVFATRSPFRPNPIGLSCVRLVDVTDSPDGPVLTVAGADLADGTPILDIKPYLPLADCVTEATGGFSEEVPYDTLRVLDPEGLLSALPEQKREALRGVLSLDPRPSYHDEPERVYGFGFAGYEVKFSVREDELTVLELIPG
ncbi:MAG: tRNA (N6-threonylcarbamoyladenosine(37)-N6)-methyltransferase TrmO [Clostridia bacterium]|nr:tRNA (N6-threonylcarbamoyladenosine(37)-N6)-methyltransferase TrmO [Clostridia bacterium]